MAALAPEAERRKLLQSLAPYYSDTELYNIAKGLAEGNLELSLAAGIRQKDGMTEKTVSVPCGVFGKSTLRETAPYFAKALGEMMGNTEPGLRRIAGLVRCPVCGEKLQLINKDEKETCFVCKNGHRYGSFKCRI